MAKKDRLSAIIDLIGRFEIDTQEELTDKLNGEGFDVSQATVSRDINELNLIKTEGITKKTKYAKPVIFTTEIPENIKNMIKQMLVSVDFSNNLVVVKTRSGMANAMAAAIDGMHFKHVLGTLAGDDTLLIIVKNANDAVIVVKAIKNL